MQPYSVPAGIANRESVAWFHYAFSAAEIKP
jgi:hypothetical protein